MWINLNDKWKMCFSLAWEAFCNGNTPVGAIITNQNGEVVARSRNGYGDKFPKRISHAEMNAISNIDEMEDMNNLALFTTLEPCVMCFSTMYMQKIGKLFYACSDPHAGGIFLYKSCSYFSLRNMDIVQFDNVEFCFVNAVLNITYEIMHRASNNLNLYLNDWNTNYSLLVKAADAIHQNKVLDKFTADSNVESLYNCIASYKEQYLL